MKKYLAGLSALLLLTSCSLTEPIPIQGEVVDCTSITSSGGVTEPLACLGGGDPISVDGIKGPALINVWGTWCAPCKQELPHLAHFLQRSDGKVDLIGVAVEEKSPATVKKFIERNGMSWPVLYDKTGSTRSLFGMGVPVTWFVNSQGVVVHKKYGPFKSTEEIQLAVSKYLGKP